MRSALIAVPTRITANCVSNETYLIDEDAPVIQALADIIAESGIRDYAQAYSEGVNPNGQSIPFVEGLGYGQQFNDAILLRAQRLGGVISGQPAYGVWLIVEASEVAFCWSFSFEAAKYPNRAQKVYDYLTRLIKALCEPVFIELED